MILAVIHQLYYRIMQFETRLSNKYFRTTLQLATKHVNTNEKLHTNSNKLSTSSSITKIRNRAIFKILFKTR